MGGGRARGGDSSACPSLQAEATICQGVMPSKAVPAGDRAVTMPATSPADISQISRENRQTAPDCGASSSRAISRKSAAFPDPALPARARHSPPATERLTPSRLPGAPFTPHETLRIPIAAVIAAVISPVIAAVTGRHPHG